MHLVISGKDSPVLCASNWDKEFTATLHNEQYSNFLAFSSSDSEMAIVVPFVLLEETGHKGVVTVAAATAAAALADSDIKVTASALESWLESLAFRIALS